MSWKAALLAFSAILLGESDWPHHGRNRAEDHFSPLRRIDGSNVKRLGLAWSMEIDTTRGLEATPIVVDGVMYFSGAWGVVYAVNARNGELRWRWDPKVAKVAGAAACCDVVSRGVAVENGRVYAGITDGRLVSLAAATGGLLWSVQTTDPRQPYTITGAPRVAKGKVFIGNAGAEYGVRGYVSAYDSGTGKLAWRFYTVPGDPAKGFESPAMERAAKTWTGQWWKAGGGGTVWDAIVYDPEFDLLFVGTGNGSPWNSAVRSPGGGDNLYLASILALRPESGELVWHYQTTPGDTWDYTATQPIILADLTIRGRLRKVLLQAPKNGFFYVLDRRTGELISAELILPATWTTGMDMKTGRPVEAPGARYEKAPFLINPDPRGRHNYEPMALSPLTGLVYIPIQQGLVRYSQAPEYRYREGQWNLGLRWERLGAADPASLLIAWDPVSRRERWRVVYASYPNGGVLATAGGLVFQGTADGRFAAYRDADGARLWEFPAGIGIIAAPITYELDGVQYVSVLAGWGGASGFHVNYTGNHGTTGRLLTFALDGKAAMIPVKSREYPALTPIGFEAAPERLKAGEGLYLQFCARCHGRNASSGGPIRDLRRSEEAVFGAYESIVLRGAMRAAGMPSFEKDLNAGEVAAIRNYVLSRRAALPASAGGPRP